MKNSTDQFKIAQDLPWRDLDTKTPTEKIAVFEETLEVIKLQGGSIIPMFPGDKGMAQVDLAVALNVDFQIDITQNGVSEIERKVRQVKDYEVTALASLLDVHPLWILYGDDVPEEYR